MKKRKERRQRGCAGWGARGGGGGAHGEGGLLLAYLPNDAADLLGGEQKQQLGSA